MKRHIPIVVFLSLAAVAALGFASFLVLEFLEPSFYYHWKQERMVERVLAAKPDGLLSAARELLQNRPGFVGEISPSASEIPSALRRLKPTRISFATNSVSVDFSDVFNPFGITVYARGFNPPVTEYGLAPRQWIEGLWLYDDGQLEVYGKLVGPANGSLLIRSRINSTSTAVDSPR